MARARIRRTVRSATKRTSLKRTVKRQCRRTGRKRTCYAPYDPAYSTMRKAGIRPVNIGVL